MRLTPGPHNTTVGGMVEVRMTPDAAAEALADIETVAVAIAEREGLEREVERLTAALSGQETDNDSYRAVANSECNRAEAAESKLSALSEAAGKVVDACACGLLGQWDLDSLRALLHPTVPVENNT
jgi:hypothetical protein